MPESAKKYPYSIENGGGEVLVFLGIEHTSEGDRIRIEGSARPGAGPPTHVHYLQEEVVRVTAGRIGYQVLGQAPKFAGPGEQIVWPAGTPHRWWNAGEVDCSATGWCRPPGNVEYYLSNIFASMARNGGKRPGLFDAAFLTTRYKTEFGFLGAPAPVRKVVLPALYVIGKLLGTFEKFKDAPEPVKP